uniref:hypothetical protein n=1 Tax=Prevotella sp. TaxID=59823 RepID=UPI0040286753
MFSSFSYVVYYKFASWKPNTSKKQTFLHDSYFLMIICALSKRKPARRSPDQERKPARRPPDQERKPARRPPDQERKPARRSPDLKSGVKKCPNLLRLCGFAIRSKG